MYISGTERNTQDLHFPTATVRHYKLYSAVQRGEVISNVWALKHVKGIWYFLSVLHGLIPICLVSSYLQEKAKKVLCR